MKKKQNEANPSVLESLLGDGKKISRREFMGRSAALGVSLSVASSLWARSVHAATPKRGGEVKIATTNSANRKILEITRLDQHLEVFDSVIDAVKSFH